MQKIALMLVFLGGGLGSCSRYLISKFLNEQIDSLFPWGTLTVNLMGCLIIGIVIGLIERFTIHPYWGILIVTGFCGGFTTFSSFSLENNLLLRNQEYFLLFLYIFISLFWGFVATFLGIMVVKRI